MISATDFFSSSYGLIAAAVALLIAHYFKTYSHWRNLKIPGPLPLPFVGTFYQLFLKPTHEAINDNYKKYGSVYGFYEDSRPSLMVSDPEMLKLIFVKEFHSFRDRRRIVAPNKIIKLFLTSLVGDHWKRMRSIMSPTFSSAKIKSMFPLIDECSNSLVNALKNKPDFELKSTWGRMTMDVIAKACFATNIDAYKEGEMENNKFVQMGVTFFRFNFWRFAFVMMIPSFFRRWIGATGSTATDFFTEVTQALIEKRRANNANLINKDFLQILLDAQSNNETKDHEPLTDDEIIAQSVLFFAAGYETTGSLLTFASWQLAHYQDKQEKLYNELVKAFPDKKIDYDTLMNLPYLDAVCCETLRLNSPVISLARRTTEPFDLPLPDGRTLNLKTGDMIQIPVYSIHHDAKYYPNPKKFEPERFMPENKDKLVPYTYLPFGSGPRNCIGMRFALTEAKLALVKLLLHKRLSPSPKTKELDFSKARILLQIQDAYVNVEDR